jgi:hypothetical protein
MGCIKYSFRHPSTLISVSNLGALLQAKGDLAAAEPLYREALEVRRETLGDRHPDTLTSIKESRGRGRARGGRGAPRKKSTKHVTSSS